MSRVNHSGDTDNRRFNLFGHAFKSNPHPTYAAMRAEAPICRRTSSDGRTSIWFLTRYADVAGALREHQRFVKSYRNTLTPCERAQLPPDPPLLRLLSNHMLNLDVPDHTRLRGLVNKAFTARMVESLEPRVESIAHQLLDRVAARGHMDLIDEFAFPLPIIVIAELLGIPPADRNRFRSWSHAFVTSSANVQRGAKKVAKAQELMLDFTTYMRDQFQQRRYEPRDDLLTSLLQAEEAGDQLSEEELFSMVILLIVAGHETMVNALGNGVLALLRHSEQMAQLRRDPSLTPGAVEEMLRYDAPVERATTRFAATDVTLDGQTIRRGDVVSLVLSSANRDGAQFPHPDAFDIAREPTRHLSFGRGIHYCLGAPLARLEARVAVDALLQRLPPLRLAVPVESLRWRTIPVIRGMQHMPVAWERA
jgi:cytochrome P450 PksS